MIDIVSWNVNGIRAIEKKGFLAWLTKLEPDILCLQETKSSPEQLSENLLNHGEYKAYWSSAERKGYSGTGIYTKLRPLSVQKLDIAEFDAEGRTTILEFESFYLVNCYFPNSQSQGKRLDYKLAFNNALQKKLDYFVKKEQKNIVLCGDLNVAHQPIDLARPDDNHESPGFLPEERAWFDGFVSSGYVDTFRIFNKEPENYTWWSYRTRARERNIGWRIDYFCVNEKFADKVKEANILSDVLGSDHCPVAIKLELD